MQSGINVIFTSMNTTLTHVVLGSAIRLERVGLITFLLVFSSLDCPDCRVEGLFCTLQSLILRLPNMCRLFGRNTQPYTNLLPDVPIFR